MDQVDVVAGSQNGTAGLASFLRSAVAGMFTRETLIPGLLLMVLLTASNIVILLNMPTTKGALPPAPFLVAAAVRIAGILLVAVALLRLATASERPRWLPDGGFGLYALSFATGLLASALARLLTGGRTDLTGLLISNVVVTLLLAPLVPWFVALAVAKPLAWRPRFWMRRLGDWLPPLLVWTLLLVMPMAILHATIDMWLIQGAGGWFWPAALFDGVLSTLMALIGLALNAAAYRRVARG